MANAKDKDAAFGVGTIVAPPVSSGRPTTFKPEILAEIYKAIHGTGEMATLTDGDGNAVTFKGEKAKMKAGGMATRVKKALLNSPDTDYTDPKELRSRTWESDGAYYFAVYERGEGGDESDE